MLASVLENILLGITGGIISSLIVSRIFLIDSNYKEEFKIIDKFMYYMSYINGVIDFSVRLREEICDIENNKSEEKTEKENAWKAVGMFLDNEGIAMLKNKAEDLEKEMFGVYVKDEQLAGIRDSLDDLTTKIKKIDRFTFLDLRECQEKIKQIRKKYSFCVANKRRTFLKKILFDKVMFALYIVILGIIALFVASKVCGL